MKKLLYGLALISLLLAAAACNKEKKTPVDPTPETPKAEASFTWLADGLVVTFTNTSKNATKYTWNFGDDETSTDANPVHTYATSGDYEVSLKAVAADGTSNTAKQTLKVAGKAFVAFSYEAGFGRLITFDGNACENVEPSTAVWDFGDGTKDETGSLVVEHNFPEDKTYEVTLTVNDLLGAAQKYTTSVTVAGDFNLLKGSDMSAESAQYWKYFEHCENNTKMYMEFEFGSTADGPAAGEGGCLRIIDWGVDTWQCTHLFLYQPVEVEEGKTYAVTLAYKVPEVHCTAMSGIRLYFANSTDLRQALYPEERNDYPGFRSGGEYNALRYNVIYCDSEAGDEPGRFFAKDDVCRYEFVAPVTGTIYFGLNILFGEKDTPGDWYIDNVKLELVPDAPAAD